MPHPLPIALWWVMAASRRVNGRVLLPLIDGGDGHAAYFGGWVGCFIGLHHYHGTLIRGCSWYADESTGSGCPGGGGVCLVAACVSFGARPGGRAVRWRRYLRDARAYTDTVEPRWQHVFGLITIIHISYHFNCIRCDARTNRSQA